MNSRVKVAPIVARQDGVISVEQARTIGVSRDAIRGFRGRGEWVPMLPGVFRVAEARPTAVMRIRAAALWAGQPSCIGGLAAAQWWGLLDQPATTIQVVVPRNRGLRPRPGITVRRRYLDPADRAQVRGVAVTGLALTALQSAVQLGADGPALLDRAMQQRVSFAELRAAHYRNLGCHGSRKSGDLLISAGDRASAVSERLFIQLMKKAGISGWQVNARVRLGVITRQVDFVFARARVAVEIDGWAWHHTPDRFQQDRAKQNALVHAGWRVLRFTWFDLTERPNDVIAQLRQALAAAA